MDNNQELATLKKGGKITGKGLSKLGKGIGKLAWFVLKKILIWVGPVIVPILLAFIGLFAVVATIVGSKSNSDVPSLSDNVEKLRPSVQRYAEQYKIPDYTDLALCIIQQYSNGEGIDVMNSSYSYYLTNSIFNITQAETSIDRGVETLSKIIEIVKPESNIDYEKLAVCVQMYEYKSNYKPSYIDFINKDYEGKYTTENSKIFWENNGSAETIDYEFGEKVILIYYSKMQQSGEYIYPMPNNKTISSNFGYRVDPITGEQGEFHKGTDFPAPVATEVLAVANGEVISVLASHQSGGYGEAVKIKHPNGLITHYAHNSQVSVRVGQLVNQGDVIALSGNTGNSTGPHLHLEFILNEQFVDAMDYIGKEEKVK